MDLWRIVRCHPIWSETVALSMRSSVQLLKLLVCHPVLHCCLLKKCPDFSGCTLALKAQCFLIRTSVDLRLLL